MKDIDLDMFNKGILKGKYLLDQKIINKLEEYEMFRLFYKIVLKECSYKLEDHLIDKIAFDKVFNMANYQIYDDVKESLASLSQSYELVLLSDNWPSGYEHLRYFDILQYFSKIYISSMYGELKEQGMLFNHPINDLDLIPSETIFIDDREDLLNIAVSKGFNVILMNRENLNIKSQYPVINNLHTINNSK